MPLLLPAVGSASYALSIAPRKLPWLGLRQAIPMVRRWSLEPCIAATTGQTSKSGVLLKSMFYDIYGIHWLICRPSGGLLSLSGATHGKKWEALTSSCRTMVTNLSYASVLRTLVTESSGPRPVTFIISAVHLTAKHSGGAESESGALRRPLTFMLSGLSRIPPAAQGNRASAGILDS